MVVNLGLDGSSSSSDYTLGGETIISGDFSSDGLVLNYTFNGDTTVATDGTTNDNDGTVQGATPVEDRFGAENSAFLFDGEDDYISVPNTESLQIEEDITLSAWIKSEANLNYHTEYV